MTEHPQAVQPAESRTHLPPGFVGIRELGSGSSGTVTLARQVALDRLVAVKSILGGAHAGPVASARFRREARALARLQHPAVVRVYDLLASDDDVFLVMEYVEGRSLRELLDRETPGYPARLAVLRCVAAALRAGAACGVVHRDVKPSNVLVRKDGAAKLADFGLARLQADAAAFRTMAGMVSGTPSYMSPEQAAGQEEPDQRSDAYSFGVLAFEVLVGAMPPTAASPEFPRAAVAVLRAALASDPSSRPLPADVMAALSALPETAWPEPPPARAARPELMSRPATEAAQVPVPPVIDRAVGHRPRSSAPDGPVADVSVPVYDPGPDVRRRRRRTGLVVTGLVALTAGLAVVLAAQRPHPDLEVTALAVSVEPQLGRCPTTVFLFTALMHTNGQAGQVQVGWQRPDGTTTPASPTFVRRGQTAIRARLRFRVSGTQPFTGTAVVQLSQGPQGHRQAASHLRYVCP